MGTVGYLLDTHTFLWAVSDSRKLGEGAKRVIGGADAPLYLSTVSAYEITYKHHIGKLPNYAHVAENYLDILKKSNACELSISTKHACYAGEIEWDHRDPFDRILAAQAFVDNLTLISNDPAFIELSWVTVLW